MGMGAHKSNEGSLELEHREKLDYRFWRHFLLAEVGMLQDHGWGWCWRACRQGCVRPCCSSLHAMVDDAEWKLTCSTRAFTYVHLTQLCLHNEHSDRGPGHRDRSS